MSSRHSRPRPEQTIEEEVQEFALKVMSHDMFVFWSGL